jgi:hypothetical protein
MFWNKKTMISLATSFNRLEVQVTQDSKKKKKEIEKEQY